MDKKLNPKDLKSFINKDNRFKRAEAILKNDWENLLLSEPWGMTTITLADIHFARQLESAHVVEVVVDLTTFSGVQQFILDNHVRLSPAVVQSLKEPFL